MMFYKKYKSKILGINNIILDINGEYYIIA